MRKIIAALQTSMDGFIEGPPYEWWRVPLRVVGDLLGRAVRLAWRKVLPYVEEERRRSGSQKTFEWFQRLARSWNDIRQENRREDGRSSSLSGLETVGR